MRGVATFHIKQHGEKWLSAINDGGEPIKNPEYLLQFEDKFENPSDTK